MFSISIFQTPESFFIAFGAFVVLFGIIYSRLGKAAISSTQRISVSAFTSICIVISVALMWMIFGWGLDALTGGQNEQFKAIASLTVWFVFLVLIVFISRQILLFIMKKLNVNYS